MPRKSRVHSPSSGRWGAPRGGCDDVDGAHSCPESKSHAASSELLGWERWPGGHLEPSGPPLCPSCPQFEFSCLVVFNSLQPWTTAYQASLSITNSWSLLKLISIESMMPSNHVILHHPLLLLPSISPASGSFSNESIFHIRCPKYWSFSFSISPSNEYSD